MTSSSFIQVPIEDKVGKGNRILRPLKRDPLIEVSAYRDNQFKVWLITMIYDSSLGLVTHLINSGHTTWTRSSFAFDIDSLYRKLELLHNRGTNHWTVQVWLHYKWLINLDMTHIWYDSFSKCGDLKRVVMGLDKVKRTPCGFCFVEYYTRDSANNAMRWYNRLEILDYRYI